MPEISLRSEIKSYTADIKGKIKPTVEYDGHCSVQREEQTFEHVTITPSANRRCNTASL